MNELLEQILAAAKAMQWIEVFAVLSGIAYVILAAKEHIACWFFGIISAMLFVIISVQATYYQDAILNAYYVGMGAYGWLHWKRQAVSQKISPIISKPIQWHLRWIAIGAVLSFVSGWIFDTYTDNSLAYWDGITTVFSFIATWMVARKVLQNWLYWIIVDSLCVYLYYLKSFYLVAFLFIIYVIISVVGYIQWRKNFKEIGHA